MGLKSQLFTVSGTFNVPGNITSVWLTMIGGGGGGGGCVTFLAHGGGGGGSGEYCIAMPVPVSSGASVAVTIGANGVGGTDRGTNGGDTYFGNIVAKGGKGGRNAADIPSVRQASGDGGGDNGGHIATATDGVAGGLSPFRFTGGGCGGWEGSGQVIGTGRNGANSINGFTGGIGGSSVSTGPAGGGGAASPFGNGGNGANYTGSAQPHNGTAAASTAYGAAGGGGNAVNNPGLSSFGGNGAGGYCLITWIG